ncbi:hypothetical protein SAMN05443572_11693 [Myxococcus fulvus]|uniref:Lipoprotein n=2 Tax=Myxococcus fulvus TaxID=33 RepID=A0A511TGN7_MYXFU|nr:hypothetical protein MFU01_83480 [Myxococcus fulvus]SEU41127.1 hypothetical protein SAMN05443572_11693 [Myxococcus fulvus]
MRRLNRVMRAWPLVLAFSVGCGGAESAPEAPPAQESSQSAQPDTGVWTKFRADRLPDGTMKLSSERLSSGDAAAMQAQLLGEGWVEWHISNPQGSGYSVKPENSNTLVWGALPSQAIDGIYRKGWGCDLAFKVPNFNIAHVQSDGSMYCWRPSTVLEDCYWVDPDASNVGWPRCPLQ